MRPTVREVYSVERADDKQVSIEEIFFQRLRLKSGVYKSTYAKRLDDVNETLIKNIQPSNVIQIMDVAISAGFSTLELSQALTSKNIQHHITATDINIYSILFSFHPCIEILVGGDDFPLQIDLFGVGVPSTSETVISNSFILLLKWPLAALVKIFRALKLFSYGENFSRKYLAAIPVTLVSKVIGKNHNIAILDDDITQPTKNEMLNKFDVLRAANILNKRYFSDSTLIKSVGYLLERVKPDGILVVCRTNEQEEGGNKNNGTVFQKLSNNKIIVIDQVGEGSDIEQMLLGVFG